MPNTPIIFPKTLYLLFSFLDYHVLGKFICNIIEILIESKEVRKYNNILEHSIIKYYRSYIPASISDIIHYYLRFFWSIHAKVQF